MDRKGAMSKSIVIIIIAVVIIGAVILYLASNSSEEKSSASRENTGTSAGGEVVSPSGKKAYTVEITDSGFSPGNLEINQGDSVTWINKGEQESWPASAMHPTHTIYPGSDIKKCGTSEESRIFDACRSLVKGESWSFTFSNKGSWGYHDHLNTGRYGKIIVK